MKDSVVSNTGPIVALSIAGKLDILHCIYREVIVPKRVHQEILEGGKDLAGLRVYKNASWIKVVAPRTPMDPLLETILDKGEASVIHLCREKKINFVLIDERKARKIAREIYGLSVIGSGGVLLEGKRKGFISNVGEALEVMRKNGYWIHDSIVKEILKLAGEL